MKKKLLPPGKVTYVHRGKSYELDRGWYLKAVIQNGVLDFLSFLRLRAFCLRLLVEDFFRDLGASILWMISGQWRE